MIPPLTARVSDAAT